MRKLNTQLIRVGNKGRCAFSILAARREKEFLANFGGVSDLTNIFINDSLTVFKALKRGFPRFSPIFEGEMVGLRVEYQRLKTVDLKRFCYKRVIFF